MDACGKCGYFCRNADLSQGGIATFSIENAHFSVRGIAWNG
jgi:hypothetical protein